MKRKYLSKIKNEKSNMVNIIIYSVILGILVNYVSDSINEIFNPSSKTHLIIGLTLIIILIIILLLYNIKRLSTKIIFDCTFIQDKNKSLVIIPEYKISENMSEYLNAALAENKAIEQQWLNTEFSIIKSNEKSNELLKELLEYVLLENFSIFITDYFNLLNKCDKTFTLNRNDIPEIVINNRFLKMISENISNRSAFIDITNDELNIDNLVWTKKNGAIYHRFELTLPIGSKIYKKNDLIIISTKLFDMSFKIHFDGTNEYIDFDLINYYSHKDPKNLSCYSFKIELNVKYKLFAAFKFYDWKYYNWLDEYIEKLYHFCDINCFYNDINWNNIKALIEIQKSYK